MKHIIIFSGQQIDLAGNVEQQLESALLLFYPQEIVKLKGYTEVDPKTCEIEIERSYEGSAGLGLGQCVNYHDMSLITGIDLSAFEPWSEKPLVGTLIPWLDNMVYCPDQVFGDLYKRQNEVMAQEKIKRVSFLPTTNYIKIRVEYER